METKNDPIHTPEHRRADGIALISQVARQINASLDLRETLDAIVCAAAELVPCTLAAIDLWDEPRQRLVLQALHSVKVTPVGLCATRNRCSCQMLKPAKTSGPVCCRASALSRLILAYRCLQVTN